MAGDSLLKDARKELGGKAVIWAPAIAGAVVAGPVGAVVGMATGIAIAIKISDSSQSDPKSD